MDENLRNKYKVNNAIILAAGFGSRFLPITNREPKGLLKVLGEPLTERMIKQLHQKNIDDITIVVGHMKEKFDYLIDKYNVKLLYNPDYKDKNSLFSLFHAKHLLKNTYILACDNYFTENIFNNYEDFSWYACVEGQDFYNEWFVQLDNNNRMIDICIGGSSGWYLLGPAFLSEDFNKGYIKIIETLCNQNNSKDYYWEEAFRINLKKLLLYGKKFDKSIIYEFDNLEELISFDENFYKYYNKKVIEVINSFFKVTNEEIKNFKPLKLGMTNNSFRFKIKEIEYICRIPGEGTDKLIDRNAEFLNYEAIKDYALSDVVLYFDAISGIKISIYEINSKVIDKENKMDVNNCLNLMRKLHNLNIKVPHNFIFRDKINFYEDLCLKNNAILFQDYNDIKINVVNLLNQLDLFELPKTFAHIDAVCDNFLKLENNDLKLIDWEYAGMCDPIVDIAMFGIYAEYNQQQMDELLQSYLKRTPSGLEQFRFYGYIALSGFLWSLWAQYKISLQVDFGEYCIKMYQYFKKYYNKSNDLFKLL